MDNIIDGAPLDACGNDDLDNYVEVPQCTHSFPMELGMEFESDEHAISYYSKYARSLGFHARKGYANRKNKDKSGYVTSRKITCFKEGYRGKDERVAFVKNPRKDTRTGCLAHIIITHDQSNGKYRVTSFEAEHNHPLAPKGMIEAHEVDSADDSGTRPKSSHEFMGHPDKDQRNYLLTKRQRDMRLGEAGDLLRYFEKRRLEDPSFFFALQLDVDKLITNVFWADAKMIMDHKLFGDVVAFDTTYITNRSYRPFGLFVGTNHYRKMVIFGAALMYDETIESFKWLFETFLKAMSGRKPKTVLTDQDATISKAISSVMPGAYHRLCVWHIERNAYEHLNLVFNGSDSFGREFYRFIHEFEEEEEEFLNAWEVMLDKYNLRDNDWLKGIFALREKWAMAYGRNIFSAGMRSTQSSETFDTALRDCLKSDSDLVQFLEHFERTVDAMRYEELEASHDTMRRIPRVNMDLPLLIHARDIYTPVIFELFQDEWAKSLLVVVNSCTKDGPFHAYKVSAIAHTQEHTVISKLSDEMVSCSCKKFEYFGILCNHALKILDMVNVKMIPSHYILKRWTKDARVGSVEVVSGGDTEEDPVLKITNRYKNLCPTFVQIAIRASESKAGYELAAKYANELAAKLETIFKAENSYEAPTCSSNSLEGLDMMGNADVTKAKRLKKREVARRNRNRPNGCLEKVSSKKMSRSALLSDDVVQLGPIRSSLVNPCTSSIPHAYQMSKGLDGLNPMPWCTFQQAQDMPQVRPRGFHML